jgi:serine phosphatase RsbU (regulator of sigma subunit)
VVHDLNRTICEISPESFYASLFYAWVDPTRGQLHYVSAGHAPVLLLGPQSGRVHRLENTGTVLGLSARVGFRERSLDLEQGALLLAASDGVTDALREDEMLRILTRHAGDRPVELVDDILDAARGTADRTALAVRFKGRADSHGLEHEEAALECAAA